MILSSLNCLVKMSPYERRGDIEQERTEKGSGSIQNGYCFSFNGGAEGIRTPYLLTASQTLSQLSYSPMTDD